jgi:solute carrier family 6 amino acid transporter-like protein 5/7/9/14
LAFEPDEPKKSDKGPIFTVSKDLQRSGSDLDVESDDGGPKRQSWDNPIEFLLSCIAMSVGLGNVWRFPFVALRNGGGAFLIPYLVVLLVIGRPIYYLEMCLGQV